MKKRLLAFLLVVVMVVGMSPATVGAATGYTDKELCDMARQYYAVAHGQNPPYAAVDQTEGKYTVIHLYEAVIDNSATGMGHTSTWGWYYIDHNTGKGYDFLTNDPIDLTPYAADVRNETQVVKGVLLEGSAEYEDLRLFLHQFHFSWNDQTYDFRNVTTQERNLLQALLFSVSCYAGPTPSMDIFHSEQQSNAKDPLGKWDAFMHRKWDATQVEWVLENVFNCSQADISNLRSSLSGNTRGEYYLNGYYYSPSPGVGDDFKEAVITDIVPDGNRYHITYELHGVRGSDSLEGPYFAIVERKQISGSGKGYWSLYYHSTEPCDIGTMPDSNNGLYNVKLPFYSGLGNKTNSISVDWGWSLFDGPAFTSKEYETYDNRLAITALALSAAAEHSQKETKTLLTSVLGFEDYDHKNYDSSADQHPAVNFACKEIVVNGQAQYIFAIVVRGTEPGNLDDIWTDISSIWGGFDTAANHLHAQLGTFMGNTTLPDSDVPIGGGGRVKFFVTGHSLGGAVANIMAKNLSDVYGAKNVFAYTFAAPRSNSEDDSTGSKNIYNVLNSEDQVPVVFSTQSKRFGSNVWFSRGNYTGMYQHFSALTGGKDLKAAMDSLWLFDSVPFMGKMSQYAHATETYMSFLLALGNNQFSGEASGRMMGGGAQCPVDLDFYVETDRGPKLVGRIKDNVIDESVIMGIILRVEGDKKYFYFPIEANYTIKMTGTETGTMTYFVEKMDIESGEPIQGTGTVFRNVSLTKGKQFSSEVQIGQIAAEPKAELYVLDRSGQPEKEVLPDGKGTEIAYEPKPLVKFTDVSADAWYYDAVKYVCEQKLMNGVGNRLFDPESKLSRAQLAQTLYNKESKPAVSDNCIFTDVPAGQWYTSAVIWANSQGIVGGYGNGKFGPDDDITREQLAVMLWRYSGSPAATNKELHFNDTDEISGYALEALRWATENGIINGKGDGVLDPGGKATRAETAQMLKNFLENK